MRAIIFVNGQIDDYTPLQHLIQAHDYLIAADGGARHCLAIGRRPHALIGDLDSVDSAIIADFRRRQVYVERHPTTKDQTDLELALDHALVVAACRPIDAILLVGALGGRLDQMLGNVLILAQRDWPLPVLLVDGSTQAQLIPPGLPVMLQVAIGDTVSALPLSDRVTGITYTNMRYPLQNHTLILGSTRGMSNEVVALPATVQITAGKLLIVTSAAR